MKRIERPYAGQGFRLGHRITLFARVADPVRWREVIVRCTLAQEMEAVGAPAEHARERKLSRHSGRCACREPRGVGAAAGRVSFRGRQPLTASAAAPSDSLAVTSDLSRGDQGSSHRWPQCRRLTQARACRAVAQTWQSAPPARHVASPWVERARPICFGRREGRASPPSALGAEIDGTTRPSAEASKSAGLSGEVRAGRLALTERRGNGAVRPERRAFGAT